MSGLRIQGDGLSEVEEDPLSDVADATLRADSDALIGVAVADRDLGAFSGNTISDDLSIKAALQEVEMAVENSSGIVAPTLADLKAASILTNTNYIYNGYVYYWTEGDYTGQNDDDIIVKSDLAALSVGAWVRKRDEALIAEVGVSPLKAETLALLREASEPMTIDFKFLLEKPGTEGVWMNFQDAATQFTDAAKTTTIVDETSKIAVCEDSFGFGHDGVQATDNLKPQPFLDIYGNLSAHFEEDVAGQEQWLEGATGAVGVAGATEFTIIAMINPDAATGSVRTIYSEQDVNGRGAQMQHNTAGRAVINTVVAGSSFPFEVLQAGEFSTLVMTYKDGNFTIWKDGSKRIDIAETLDPNQTTKWRVGRILRPVTTNGYTGKIAHMVTVSRRLRVGEINDIFEMGATLNITATGKTNSMSTFRSLAEAQNQDLKILVAGDSLGDALLEVIYKIMLQLGGVFYRVGIRYRTYNIATHSYINEDIVQPSQNGFWIDIYNCSISLSRPSRLLSEEWQTAVLDLGTIHHMIGQYGHNISKIVPRPQVIGQYLALLEQFREANPNASIEWILQNPHRTDPDAQASKYEAQEYIQRVLFPELQLVDVRSAIQAISTNDVPEASLYETGDPIHLNKHGADVAAKRWRSDFDSSGNGVQVNTPPLLSVTSANMLTNGDMQAVTGGVPDGWTLQNGATSAVNTVRKTGTYTHSIFITNGAAQIGELHQELSPADVAACVAARELSLSGLVWAEDGVNVSAVVRVTVIYPTSSVPWITDAVEPDEGNGFRKIFLTPVPVFDGATAIHVDFLGSNSAVAGRSGGVQYLKVEAGLTPRGIV